MRRRVVVHGLVQGVFFRESLRRLAGERSVAGFARNLPDGTLDAVFEGQEDAVRELMAFANVGAPGRGGGAGRRPSRRHPNLSGFRVA